MRLPGAMGFVAILMCVVHANAAPSAADGALVTAEALMSIVDIGIPHAYGKELAVSPDGAHVAFQVRRYDVARNEVLVRWTVVSLDGEVVDVGNGGSPIADYFQGHIVGRHVPENPQWSADSEWIAYRRGLDGEIQLWASRRNGGAQQQLTHNAADVADFRWSTQGDRVLFKVYRARAEQAVQKQDEARRGFLYDERYSPYYSREPLPDDPSDADSRIWVYDLATRVERPADAAETQQYHRPPPPDIARAQDLRPNKEVGLMPPLTITHGDKVCRHPQCYAQLTYSGGVWSSADGARAYFLRFIDPNEFGAMALYTWTPRTDRLQTLLTTPGYLRGCARAREELVCGYETATHPMRLVAIDLRTGAQRTLYDPNSAFANHQFGEVTELRWTDKTGRPGFGYLIKPIGYRPGQRYPLVVVQYRAWGFLRGGSGDEYPIQPLAANGFAVLSFHRSLDHELMATSRTHDEVEARGWIGQRDRWLVLNSLEGGIDHLDRMGLIDPARVGISGFSDGGETVSFALIHSPQRYAAAVTTWSVYTPLFYPVIGPKFQSKFARWGFPLAEFDVDRRWPDVSISLNAKKIRAPLLLNVSDMELLPETDTVAALQAHGKPVEMHVFPDEGHVKTQPAHRYNIYRRNLQWFQFWLQGSEDPNPVDAGQYARWRALKARKIHQSGAQQ